MSGPSSVAKVSLREWPGSSSRLPIMDTSWRVPRLERSPTLCFSAWPAARTPSTRFAVCPPAASQ
eukprot:514423-Pyramimonas_sp.AAC.1